MVTEHRYFGRIDRKNARHGRKLRRDHQSAGSNHDEHRIHEPERR